MTWSDLNEHERREKALEKSFEMMITLQQSVITFTVKLITEMRGSQEAQKWLFCLKWYLMAGY